MRSVLLIAPLLLCADPAAAQVVGAPVQSIALYSYGFNPTPIVLNAGKAVTLSFVNRAGKSHDFTAEKFFRASKILSGKVGEGEVDLAPARRQASRSFPPPGVTRLIADTRSTRCSECIRTSSSVSRAYGLPKVFTSLSLNSGWLSLLS
ncbi:hypothetical protein H9L14_09315 [Sphingomonas sediminicola]|uniref:Cupredoxin domain-containing protein n=1 Tax=Sphingomonas sediminicola TaxID=386874 RepID=A0ABX6T7D5_9SPHN|nr:hypothetical protein [Sphingomonas sediminicola]QNP44925.1 hypothetical protein H9L14_09315 [Sphingomonas sediminicola]